MHSRRTRPSPKARRLFRRRPQSSGVALAACLPTPRRLLQAPPPSSGGGAPRPSPAAGGAARGRRTRGVCCPPPPRRRAPRHRASRRVGRRAMRRAAPRRTRRSPLPWRPARWRCRRRRRACRRPPRRQSVRPSVLHTHAPGTDDGAHAHAEHTGQTHEAVCAISGEGRRSQKVQSQQCGGERDEIRDSSSQAASQKSHAPSHKSDVSQVGVAASISRGEGVGEAPAKLLGGVL